MLRLRPKNRVQAKIPDASMADIAFLLIIFFMVTKSFYATDKTHVDLPASADRVRDEIATRGAINIAVTARGEVRVDGLVASMLDVQNIAEGVVARAADRIFIVRGDRQVTYKHIDEVLERLRLAGAKHVYLETRSAGGGFARSGG